MVDDLKAQASDKPEEPVKETPESPMPSEEQKTPEEVEAQPSTEETQPEGETKPEKEELPEEVKERTKEQFEKLQTQLREERALREYMQSVFDSLQTKKAEKELAPMVDPETGLLNEQAISQRDRLILEANERATRAEEAAQTYLRNQENKETYSTFPELNPEDKAFDRELHKVTRSIALDSMVNPDDYGGKQLSFKEAASLAKSRLGTPVDKIKQEAAKETLEQLTPKEQASLEVAGSANRRTEALGTQEELRRRTRKGDLDAIVERLKRASAKS